MVEIVTDHEPREWEAFLCEAVDELSDARVTSAALVTHLADGTIYTGYFNSDVQEKMLAAEHIRIDLLRDILLANYGDVLEGVDFDDPDEEDLEEDDDDE